MKKLPILILLTLSPVTAMVTSCSCSSSQLAHKCLYFKTPAIANKIYTINASSLSNEMKTTLQSLQGILAQEKAQIFIYTGDQYRDSWFNNMRDIYHFETELLHDPWELISRFKGAINSKFVLYTSASQDDKGNRDWNTSINRATVVASVDHYLMISNNLKEEAINHGLTQARDVSSSTTKQIFDEYKNRLNKKMLINQSPYTFALRDYAIASKSMTGYLEKDEEITPGIQNEVSSWVDNNAPILGWTENELQWVEKESQHNLVVLASDHCNNLSFYSHYNIDRCFQQKQRPEVQAQNGKHYLAIVMSDGDNLQWMQGDFFGNNWYGNPYRGCFPITWTMTPSALDANPSILDKLYNNMTNKDHFISGPSGYGYINMAKYGDKDTFGKYTANYMHDCDLQYINFLDSTPDATYQALEPVMKQSQVKGAVWSLKNYYIEGHGSVDWINDKPIVSMRETLWEREDKPDTEQYYRAENVAARINNYPTDISKIDAYTVLVAHAWSNGKMDKINDFVAKLDSHVELVTVDQLLTMVSKNVQHVHAQPKDYAPVNNN